MRPLVLSLLISFLFSFAVWAVDPVDLNKATEAELAQLVNIGPKKAKAIIEYREAHKGFSTIEELAEVKGIGVNTVEKNRHLLVVNVEGNIQ